MISQPTTIDLFSGCGGLSYGMCRAGFDVVLDVDQDRYALQSFTRNHPGSKAFFADISKLKKKDF